MLRQIYDVPRSTTITGVSGYASGSTASLTNLLVMALHRLLLDLLVVLVPGIGSKTGGSKQASGGDNMSLGPKYPIGSNTRSLG